MSNTATSHQGGISMFLSFVPFGELSWRPSIYTVYVWVSIFSGYMHHKSDLLLVFHRLTFCVINIEIQHTNKFFRNYIFSF